MKRYPDEVTAFIEKHIQGTTTRDLVAMVNSEFGPIFTESKMKSYKANHKLKSGTPCGFPAGKASKQYPNEIRSFIEENHVGIGPKDMVKLLNEKFGTNYTKEQLKGYYANHNINSGLDGRYPKGSIPPNKGKKGYHAPGSEKGWFAKGHQPINKMAVGTEILKGDGYIWVKIAEPNKWRQKHILLWEAENGKVPKEYIITFLDGDRTHVAMDNLALITKAEAIEMLRSGLRTSDTELTKTGILVAKVKIAGRKKQTALGRRSPA